MAFYTGTANTFDSLKTEIENACVLEGYTLSDGILSKGGIFAQFTSSSTSNIRLRIGNGQTGSSLSDVGGNTVKIHTNNIVPFVFPCNYDIHIHENPDEVFIIVWHSSQYYHQLSFGKSSTSNIGGTGNWYTGSWNGSASSSSSNANRMYTDSSGNNYLQTRIVTNGLTGGLFADSATNLNISDNRVSSYIHTGLDDVKWLNSTGPDDRAPIGWGYCRDLFVSNPNSYDDSTILLPIRAFKKRGSIGVTPVLEMKNCRAINILNLNPEQILSFGNDQWKIYPMYRKTEGLPPPQGAFASRSYNLGFAVRYVV